MLHLYLILDIDNTVKIVLEKDGDADPDAHLKDLFLSPKLMRFADATKYEGVYFCTHRCITNLDEIYDRHGRHARATLGDQVDMANHFTVNVVKNFVEKTKINLLAVSTYDDEEKPGSGFDKHMKPYELEVLKTRMVTESGVIFYNFHRHSDYYNFRHLPMGAGKNRQLLSLINDAAAKHPVHENVTLHFVDDAFEVIQAASRMTRGGLPANVTLLIHHHDAINQSDVSAKYIVKGSNFYPLFNYAFSDLPKLHLVQNTGLFLNRLASLAEVDNIDTDYLLVLVRVLKEHVKVVQEETCKPLCFFLCPTFVFAFTESELTFRHALVSELSKAKAMKLSSAEVLEFKKPEAEELVLPKVCIHHNRSRP